MAPSTGLAGSTCWVTTTSLPPRRASGRCDQRGHVVCVLLRRVGPGGGSRPTRRAQGLGERPVGEDPHECVGDLRRPARVDEDARLAVPDDIGDPARARSDDRAAAAQCLEHDARRPLGAGGEEQEPGVVERPHDVGRLEPALPRDAAGEVADERLGHVAVPSVPDDPQSPPGTRGAARRQASPIAWMFLYRSSTPTKSATGRSGSGATGGSEKAASSVYVVNTPAGSTPTSRTMPS